MVQLYVKGPRAAWHWTGACEVDTATGTYVHHPEWPKRQPHPVAQTFGESLDELIAHGQWMLYHDPWLTLPEGL